MNHRTLSIAMLALALFFNACSIYNIAYRHVSGKLKHNGLVNKVVKIENYTINYWDSENDKPVLLLLHGFGASTEFQWYKQVKALAKEYRLILPNLLFFGGSSSSAAQYRIADQVSAVEALLAHLGVDRFYAAGTSYGSVVAAELALRQPQRIQKLALFDSPLKYFKQEDVLPICREFGVETPGDLLVPKEPILLRSLLKIAYSRPPKAPLWVLRDMHRHLYIEQAEEKRQLLQAMAADGAEFSARHYPFDFPILLLWGAEDRLIPVEIGEKLKADFGENAELHVIPKTAHAPNLENAKLFNQLFLAFLKK